ncbi:MAG: VOC family protein [Vicingaceae bacterium]
MKKVTGLGGIFYKVADPEKHRQWYKKHLGIESDKYGGHFKWRDNENPKKQCMTAWSPFDRNTNYFDPSKQDFMINYRVENLEKLIEILKKEGVKILGGIDEFDYGKFAWIQDVDGYKIELWEAVDEILLNTEGE